MEISLVPIRQSPKDAELALSWALDLWGDHLPNYSPQDWANFYTNSVRSNYESWEGEGQELVFIAKRGEETVGTIGLVDFDELEEFRHLSPWIAAFIVNPHVRGEGAGTKILTLLEEKARSLGIDVLHLWTEDQRAFYSKRGYQLLASTKLGFLDIDVMQKRLVIH
jgi:N-acetylglutamate synthase-like GNAT family acetyltransferase